MNDRLAHIMIEYFQDVISIDEKYNVSNRIDAYIFGLDRVVNVVRARGINS